MWPLFAMTAAYATNTFASEALSGLSPFQLVFLRDPALDKTHYRLKDVTGLLLDGTYHVNHIKKGSACTPLSIVDKFDTYETALKNTLLNKFAIETLNNKL